MTHIWLLLWPKLISATKCDGQSADSSATAAAAAKATSSRHCYGLKRLVRKLKKQSRMLRAASRPSSGSCKYDPLSYSLNFDSSGWGSFLDGDYYQFHAFTSRFMANPPTVVVAASSH